jgi:hypothetical protein
VPSGRRSQNRGVLTLAIQLTAVMGPIILTVMGAVVSIKPPASKGYGRWIWATCFIVVGLLTACTLFIELRGTDETLGSILNKLSSGGEPPHIDVSRMESNKEPTSDQYYFNIYFNNNGKSVAKNLTSLASGIILPYNLGKDQIEIYMDKIRSAHKFVNSLHELAVGPVDIISLLNAESSQAEVLHATDQQLGGIKEGKLVLYTFLTVTYTEQSAIDKGHWQYDFCGYFVLSFAYWHRCDGYERRVFVTDGS